MDLNLVVRRRRVDPNSQLQVERPAKAINEMIIGFISESI